MSGHLARVAVLAALGLGLAQAATAQSLAAAVLPSGRSVMVGATASAYASLINTGSATATGCKLAPATQVAATFSYQTTNSATNAPTGSANTPADIPAGGVQSFVFTFTPTAAFAPTDVSFAFTCNNAQAAPVVSGVNTLLLSASATSTPDVIATAATTTSDGIVHVPSASGTGVFATAAINIGAGGSLTVTPVVLGGAQVNAFVCETNPSTAACLSPPAASATSGVSTNETRTYSVFVAGKGSLVAPDFAARRVRLEFRDSGGAVRGATSVAVCTVGSAGCEIMLPYIAVSTDPTKNTYPSTYTTVTTRPQVDVCDIHGDKVYYPPSWNGAKPLPAITGAPLNTGLDRIVDLKDVFPSPPPTLPARCGQPTTFTDANYTEAARTFARLKAENVDYVRIDQWHWAYIKPDGSFGVTPYAGNALTDAQMTMYVQLAHAAGLKVAAQNQIQGFVTVSANETCYCFISPSIPPSNADSWTKWLAAFRDFSLRRAALFQSIGVDLWEVGCGNCVYGDRGDDSSAALQQFGAAYTSLLPEITAIYKGKTYATYSSWMQDRPTFVAGIGAIETAFYSTIPLNENTVTVAAAKASYQDAATNGINFLLRLGKPLLIHVAGVQSRGNFYSLPGYVEELTCTDAPNALIPSPTACIQLQTPTDFALQAILVEAALELVGGLNNLPAGSGVFMLDYWQTDFLGDGTGPSFPQLGNSVRNKPAEAIMRAWFAR